MTDRSWWSAAKSAARRIASESVTSGRAGPTRFDHEAYIHRFLLRCGLVVALEAKGWFPHPSGRALWDTVSCDDPGPYRAEQRLSLLFFSGLGQPSERARKLIAPYVGEVPYLGGGLFSREASDEEAERLLGPNGPLSCALRWMNDPETLGLARASSSVPTPQVSGAHKDFATGFHLHDPACGAGDILVAEVHRAVSSFKGDGRKIAEFCEGGVSGLDTDELNVQTTRFRIGLAALFGQESDVPFPLPDLRRTVRLGAPLPTPSESLVEGPRIELKAAFDWHSGRKERSRDLQLGVLKTIAAFLNGEGGKIYIGVADDGTPVGIAQELESIPDPRSKDVLEGRIREAIKNHVEPLPLQCIKLSFELVSGVEVLVVEVAPKPGVSYIVRKGPDGRMLEEVFVRDGNRTLNLSGRARDEFVLNSHKALHGFVSGKPQP